MHYIGKLDKKLYNCIASDIVTDEVIITDERIAHIKERHPGDYDTIKWFLKEAIKAPDYILRDKNYDNTGLILKLIEKENLRFQLILKIQISVNNIEFKNSIISAWKISEKRWDNYLKNKNILYKRE